MYTKLLLLTASILSIGAQAATLNTMDDVTPTVARYLFKSPSALKGMYDVGIYFETKLVRNESCTESVHITPISMGLISPITYDLKAEYPEKGSWSTRFKLERCQTTSIYNVLFSANGKTPPKAGAFYPGESLTDPRLYVDALTPAIMAVKAQWPKCEDFYIADTKVLQEPVNNAWVEAWTFQGCKQSKVLTVTFTPDPNGGTNFSINSPGK